MIETTCSIFTLSLCEVQSSTRISYLSGFDHVFKRCRLRTVRMCSCGYDPGKLPSISKGNGILLNRLSSTITCVKTGWWRRRPRLHLKSWASWWWRWRFFTRRSSSRGLLSVGSFFKGETNNIRSVRSNPHLHFARLSVYIWPRKNRIKERKSLFVGQAGVFVLIYLMFLSQGFVSRADFPKSFHCFLAVGTVTLLVNSWMK